MSNNNQTGTDNFLKGIEKFYGILYLLVLVFLVYLGARYVKTLDRNNLFYSKEQIAADTNMRSALPVKKGTTTPPIDLVKFTTADKTLAEKGKGLYTTNCASCHGETGAGNGAAGAALNPPPRNFVDINAQQWKVGKTISSMYEVLENGIAGGGMASFSNIPPEDRFAILQYIQTFSPDYPKDTPDDLSKLDAKYSLSKGVKGANQIPVQLAKELELKDYDAQARVVEAVVRVVSLDNSDAAQNFRKMTSDPERAVNSLAASTAWAESAEAFGRFLAVDPASKGFRADASKAGADVLSQVQQYLLSLFVKGKI